jgi:hypothetical protein
MLKVCCFLFFGVFAGASAGWCQRPTPIRLVYSSPTITNAPIWIASDLGIFKKHGVDTELTFITSSTTLTQAMVAGEVQFAQMGIGPAIPASLNSGKQFVALFAIVSLRVRAQFPLGKADPPRTQAGSPSRSAATYRKVRFSSRVAEAPVLQRDDITAGFESEGPMIIEEQTSTVVVEPGWKVRSDGEENLMLGQNN